LVVTHERFIGFLIEHYAGNFPLWLAPDQVRVITLNDDEALINYAKPIVAELRANMVRVDADYSATPFKAKIANAEQLRIHTMLVIGGRAMEAGAVSVRLHHGGPQGAKPKAEVVADILASIKDAAGVIIFQANGPQVFACGPGCFSILTIHGLNRR
jgi:threonyl-tRNA synthetase